MYLRRRGGGGGSVRNSSSSDAKPVEEKKNFGDKFKEGMGKLAHGVGTVIQGAVVASDRTLDSVRTPRDRDGKSNRNKQYLKDQEKKRKRKERQPRDNRNLNNSSFSEEQKKELSILFEQNFADREEDEYEDLTEEQDEEDDGYFGITDPGLTAPTMTMGIRNSFGDFFGNTADAMESHINVDRVERKRSIYR
jgi:hypothetical protein